MHDTRQVVLGVAVTAAMMLLSGPIDGLAGPPRRRSLQLSGVNLCCAEPADRVETARDVLNAASELCLRSRPSPRYDLLAAMAAAWSRAGDATRSEEMFKLALKVASNMTDAREHYRALLAIAVSQAGVGGVDAAVRTSELATSPGRRVGILRAIARTLSEAGRVQDALAAARRIPADHRMDRSIAVCGVASDMADRGDCSQAVTVLGEIKPNMGDAQKLHLRQQAGANLNPAEEEVVGQAASKAVGLLNVAQCYARAGRFVEAAKLAETIGFGDFSDRGLRRITSIAAHAGNLEVARRIASQIRDEVEKDMALGDVAVGEAAKGLRDDSLKTVAAITRAEIKGETMMRIVEVLARSGEHAEAEKLFAAAEKEQLTPEARIAAQLKIAQALAEHRKFTSAEEIAEGVQDQAARARIIAAIGIAYGKAGDTTDAQRSFQKAYECALRIDDRYESSKVLRELAESQIAAKDRSGAAYTLREASRIAATIPAAGGTNVIALQEVAVAQAESGDQSAAKGTFQLAMNAAKAYEDQEYAAQLARDVMKAQTECGDSETALESANKLESGIVKCGCLFGIALGLLQEPKVGAVSSQ